MSVSRNNCSNIIIIGISVFMFTVLSGCSSQQISDDTNKPSSQFSLEFSTYWGGREGATRAFALAVDSRQNIYLAGATQNHQFPLLNPVINANNTTTGFISAFSPLGDHLVFSTYLGARTGYNWCHDILADSQGNILAAGLAGGRTFPLLNALYEVFTGEWKCGFLSSIAPENGTLNFSTFIPHHRIIAMDMDSAGDIYLASWSRIIKISADGQKQLYEYTLPCQSASFSRIAVSDSGTLFVIGWTRSNSWPSTCSRAAGSGDNNDIFVMALNTGGNIPDFCVRFRGSGDETAGDVTVAPNGFVYICGSSSSADFETTRQISSITSNNFDCFVVKMNPVNGDIVYSVSFGAEGRDIASAIAVNSKGEAYVTGSTNSLGFPVDGGVQSGLGGVKDCFVTKLNSSGSSILLSTFLGGTTSNNPGFSENGADWSNDICLDSKGKIYITGETYSADFPLKNPLDAEYSFAKAFLSVLSETYSGD